ncbi:MAG: LptF/LptG family permease, partial [Lentisphaeraceae bacterium]|nr:LptF/LptG family permease [Lentisphaeraceae bacterium]
MKTLNTYVAKNLLIVFTAAIVVMSFIMLAGQLIKMLDLLSSGVSFSSFATLFLFVLPETLSFSLPIAILVAVILVFSKMSAENE